MTGATLRTVDTRQRVDTRRTVGTRRRQSDTRPTVGTRRARGGRLTRPGRGGDRDPGKGKLYIVYSIPNALRFRIHINMSIFDTN